MDDGGENRWPVAQWLHSAALALTLGVVAARCMMPETLRDPFEPAPGVELGARGAGATATVLLNLLSFLPPLLVLLGSWIDSSMRLIRGWSHLLLGALALLALASAAWATDRFGATVTAGNLLAAALLGWTALQTVRSWTQFRMVGGVAVGLLLVLVVHSILYVSVDQPEMQRMWEAQRETLLRQRNFDPQSFQAKLFEKKITGGELMGFSSSPNTVAAVAVVAMVILAGSMLDRRRLRDAAGWLAPGAVLLGCGAWLLYATGSRTSLATPLLAGGLLAMAPLLGRWSERRPRGVFWLGVAVVGLAAALVVGHGLYHGNLVERSLTFRWHYWTAAVRMVREHVLAGVGWNNFGLFYPAMKLPFAPEDVKDPHNLVVRFFSELGVVGGVLCLGWLLRSAWEVTRPVSPGLEELGPGMVRDPLPVLRPLVVPAALATVLVIVLAVDFSQIAAFYLVETLRRLMYGCLLLGGMALLCLRSVEQPGLDDRAGKWVLRATGAALGVFLLHNMIDFSFFEAGPMSLSLVLLGAAAGARAQQREGGEAAIAARWLAAPLLLLAVSYAAVIALPVARAEMLATQADAAISRGEVALAPGQYEEAFEAAAHLRNGDYLVRAARATAMAGGSPEASLALLERALAMNPRSTTAWNLKAQVLEVMHRDGTAARLRALENDPANVTLRLLLADSLWAAGRQTEAREQYRLALQYNDLLPAGEIRRLPTEREQAVRARLAQ